MGRLGALGLWLADRQFPKNHTDKSRGLRIFIAAAGSEGLGEGLQVVVGFA